MAEVTTHSSLAEAMEAMAALREYSQMLQVPNAVVDAFWQRLRVASNEFRRAHPEEFEAYERSVRARQLFDLESL